MIKDLFIIGTRDKLQIQINRGITAYCRRQDLPWRIHSINRQKMRPLELYAEQYPDRPLWLAGYIGDGLIDHLAHWGDRLRIFSANRNCRNPGAWIVHVDAQSIGRQAVDHCVQSGYANVACWGNWQRGDTETGDLHRRRRALPRTRTHLTST